MLDKVSNNYLLNKFYLKPYEIQNDSWKKKLKEKKFGDPIEVYDHRQHKYSKIIIIPAHIGPAVGKINVDNKKKYAGSESDK